MYTLPFIITAIAALIISGLLGFVVIPCMISLKAGQPINTIGPTWHKSKTGTPTMGGIMFELGIILAIALGWFLLSGDLVEASEDAYASGIRSLLISLFVSLGFSAIGFVDDLSKVLKKENEGLTPSQKIVLQVIVTVAFLFLNYIYGDADTSFWIPFIGKVELGYFYFPFAAFCIIGIVNAVNLTDGVDGLCASVTFVVSCGFVVISALTGFAADAVFSLAVAGSMIGYLFWNHKPAKIFMGDTGSMFLGGAVVAMAFGCQRESLMLTSGILYVLEAFSVMLQVSYFKLTHGKRIFKMSPIHHHFEMCGWSEQKVDIVFSLVALCGVAFSIISVIA